LPKGIIWAAPAVLLEHCAPGRVVEISHPEQAAQINRALFDLKDDGLPVEAVVRDETLRRIAAAVGIVTGAVPGERNEKLNLTGFWLGKLVREGKLSYWKAYEICQDSGEKVGIPRGEAKARSTIESGLKAGMTIGHEEPRSALLQLLAAAVPVISIPKQLIEWNPDGDDDLQPRVPIVERLLYAEDVTILSGKAGTGKTSFMAALMAASMADLWHYEWGIGHDSNVDMIPAAWIFLSYEGGRHMARTIAGWFAGTGLSKKYADRVLRLAMEGPMVLSTRRDVVVNEKQVQLLETAIVEMQRRYPHLKLNIVIDNLTAAVQDSLDNIQGSKFLELCHGWAKKHDIAVCVLAHPPKTGSSEVYGTHVYKDICDTLAVMEVIRQENGEWVQWIEFPKHREAQNDECLEVCSRKLPRPLFDLPLDWGGNHPRARTRQLRNLHLPYVTSIRVRYQRERDAIASGVVAVPTEVSLKDAQIM
jgi:hypothetical protein